MELIGNLSMPSVLNDPFKKTHIESILMSYRKNDFSGEWYSYGIVKFTNQNTKGEQRFDGSDLNEVAKLISVFIETL